MTITISDKNSCLSELLEGDMITMTCILIVITYRQTLCFQKYCLCLYIALFIFHLWQYTKLKCHSLHLILDCQIANLSTKLFWTCLGTGLGQCWLISDLHCCRMHYGVNRPLQSQPILAAGCPLAAISNDSCLSIFTPLSLQIPDWSQTSNFS